MPAAPSSTTVAGLVTALVGFLSSFAVVLTGLRAVGATPGQAASGLVVLSMAMGVATVLLAQRTRMPITVAWSTPGAALLATASAPSWEVAVGAFVLVGALVLLTAAWPRLGSAIGAIPPVLAQAMLAGVLVPLCLQPVRSALEMPWLVVPVVLVWAVLLRFSPRWAVPAAFAVTLGIIGWLAWRDGGVDAAALVPVLEWTTPALGSTAVIGLALPLFLVTMASQNVPGMAVLAAYGYRAPWRSAMAVTGAGTLLGAPFGGHAINLAAISAALAAGPEADPDPSRRYLAARTAGLTYVGFALVSAAVAALVVTAPAGFVAAAAGLALWPVLAASLSGALARPEDRIPVVATILVAISGVTVGGIGSAFWSLVVGLAFWAWYRPQPAVAPA
ncbi:benzoate/H(+) symporter BenE family transporter [Blastococcus sp. BMG 814]|uniref:Benzoate/H(+) symporter BenE family transporter n=1 Tax=Blastococcus carthaginiensis TaxID=3050034 RepID=A0ABT9IGK0_9ACTN|nr:benzoate/H(+) symporter BenE family transporter [Blastococcus carthaginiensis]MDP5184715.1 benzoate/H(+) symporter BenE family transporter [Blastococcus carthaginiensis]